jgi:hypothetical protein
MNSYIVKLSRGGTGPSAPAAGDEWNDANLLNISNYLPQSSDHQPVTEVRVLHDQESVRVQFKVSDRFVRCTRTEYQSDVWNDSCVEWFVRPKPDKGYFNFEINCLGVLHLHYVEDPARIAGGKLKKSTPVPPENARLVQMHHSIVSVLDPEIAEPLEWAIEMKVPLTFFEPFIGNIGTLSGQKWRANFNKCADQSSHPTWATWNPVSELNFHRPQEFGEIVFE